MQVRITEFSKAFSNASMAIISEANLKKAAEQVLEELCRSFNCQWGTYWQVSPELQQLRPFATWSEENLDFVALDRDTKNRTLSLSEGTAGHVWRSKKPVWTLDLTRDMCLPRSLDANQSGLTGGIWFALKTEDTMYGVIELLGQHLVPPTEELILGIESFGIHLGHLLQERSIQQHPK